MNLAVLVNPFGEICKGKEGDSLADEEVYDTAKAIRGSLIKQGHNSELVNFAPDNFEYLSNFDAVFNLVETNMGSVITDDKITKQLENKKIYFTGNGSYSLKKCNDKIFTKNTLIKNNVSTPRFLVFNDEKKKLLPFGFPVIVKPANEDASVGISFDSVAWNDKSLYKKINEIITIYKQPVIVEEYIDGREVDVSIIGEGKSARVLGISELIFNFPPDVPRIQSYEVKWMKDSDFYKRCSIKSPAELSEDLAEKIESISLKAYKLLKCKGYSRIDIRIKGGEPFILEINPNPCLAPIDNSFVHAASNAGLDYDTLISNLVMMAIRK